MNLTPWTCRCPAPTVPAQRHVALPYVPPECSKWLTKDERALVDELIRLLTS